MGPVEHHSANREATDSHACIINRKGVDLTLTPLYGEFRASPPYPRRLGASPVAVRGPPVTPWLGSQAGAPGRHYPLCGIKMSAWRGK